jgi:hypothetical protein
MKGRFSPKAPRLRSFPPGGPKRRIIPDQIGARVRAAWRRRSVNRGGAPGLPGAASVVRTPDGVSSARLFGSAALGGGGSSHKAKIPWPHPPPSNHGPRSGGFTAVRVFAYICKCRSSAMPLSDAASLSAMVQGVEPCPGGSAPLRPLQGFCSWAPPSVRRFLTKFANCRCEGRHGPKAGLTVLRRSVSGSGSNRDLRHD